MFECVKLTNSKTIDAPLETNARHFMTDGDPLSDLSLYCTGVGNLFI